MIIKTKNKKFNVTRCSTRLSQIRGFMFNFPKNDGLLFEFKKEIFVSLHMLFVFFPIDIVYLNQNKTIIKILKNVKPFISFIKPVRCKYILELKNSKNLKIGEILTINK